jgi:polyhydroxybutyrate depolymerase
MKFSFTCSQWQKTLGLFSGCLLFSRVVAFQSSISTIPVGNAKVQVPAPPNPIPIHPVPKRLPGRYYQSMISGARLRKYLLLIPRKYDSSRAIPLVVVLHGFSADARTATFQSLLARKAEQEGFILAAPEGLGKPQGWNVGFFDLTGAGHPDDVGFIGNLIDQVKSEVGVDSRNVFVVGHSNGAMLAHLVGSRLGDKVAAICAVSGTIGLPGASGAKMKQIPPPVAPVSVLIIHGKQDATVAYDRTHPAILTGVSAPNAAKWWATQNRCSRTALHSVSPNRNVETDLYEFGWQGVEVKLVSIRNGTHDWPGGWSLEGHETRTGVNATDLIWDFFRDHPKK